MEPPKYPTDAFSPDYVKAPPPMVVTTQPTMVIMSPPAHKDQLACSILNMIFCCLPLGIVALVFSIQARDANRRQDAVSAASHSRTAYKINVVALGAGIFINCIFIGLIIHCLVVGIHPYYPE